MTKESRTRSDLDFAVHPVVLYDGVCGLCNRLVRFILRRDPAGLFQFASLQSALAADILARHGADAGDLDTVYVVVNRGGEAEELLARSEAAILILMHLGAAELCSAGQPRAAVPTDATPTLDSVADIDSGVGWDRCCGSFRGSFASGAMGWWRGTGIGFLDGMIRVQCRARKRVGGFSDEVQGLKAKFIWGRLRYA